MTDRAGEQRDGVTDGRATGREGAATTTRTTLRQQIAEALNTTTFFVLAAVGIVVALGLTIYEAQKEDPLQIGSVQTERDGLTTIAEVRVRNVTDEPQCPQIRIAARDTDGQDLDEAEARPVTGDMMLTPGQTGVYRAELSDITEREYREELDEFRAYVWELGSCP